MTACVEDDIQTRRRRDTVPFMPLTITIPSASDEQEEESAYTFDVLSAEDGFSALNTPRKFIDEEVRVEALRTMKRKWTEVQTSPVESYDNQKRRFSHDVAVQILQDYLKNGQKTSSESTQLQSPQQVEQK